MEFPQFVIISSIDGASLKGFAIAFVGINKIVIIINDIIVFDLASNH
ncbi:hypothetical protein HLK66_25855 (plasmid) [Niallia circulans]|nr:hypothetical protein [Niallia circulans]QJX65109.1 hypothetical protein HLK66_25855 [Niallia circulans]